MTDERTYDEPLPWLAPVEDEDEPRGLSARRMLAALVVVLLAAALIAATFFWMGRRDTVVAGAPELIKAPPTPYKVKPSNPGGLDITGESETAFETSAGELLSTEDEQTEPLEDEEQEKITRRVPKPETEK